MSISTVNTSDIDKRTSYIAIAILGLMFFIFGFTSWINSILVPYFKIGCELSYFESYLIVFALYSAYLIMALPASIIIKKFGFKRSIMYGFFCTALGALIFIPAAYFRSYAVFLTGSFVIGAGSAILQATANPYITIIGPLDSSVRRMAIMGICNKFAGLVAPLIFAAIVLKVSDSNLFVQLQSNHLDPGTKSLLLDSLVRRVMLPYGIFAAILIIIGLIIRFSVLPEINTEEESKEAAIVNGNRTSVFQYPYLILGVIAMFLHIGTQVVTIDTIINFAQTMGMDILEAKAFPAYTLALVILGNVLGVLLIPNIISQTRIFQICCILGFIFSINVILGNHNSVVFLGHKANISIWFLVGIGLANSLIYASIWPLAIRDLGRFTKTGSSMLIMALFGNAVVPLFFGYLADKGSLLTAYSWILLPSFAFLIFYAFHGHKIICWSKPFNRNK